MSNVVAMPTPASTQETLSSWWVWWKTELEGRNVRKATVANYRKALVRLGRFVGDVDPATITTAKLREWTAHMLGEELRPSTCNNYLESVRAFYSFLVREGELTEAPRIRLVKVPPATLLPSSVYSSEEAKRLVAGAQAAGHCRTDFELLRDAAIVLLLQDSGLRASECAGLLLRNVDLGARQALVHAEIAKSGQPRVVCFGVGTARALAKYMRARQRHDFSWSEQLFIGRKGGATFHLVSKVVRKAGKRAGVDGARPHRFRHTWAHDLKSAGVNDEVLMSLGGWRSAEMLARYGRSERAARAVEAYRRVGSPADRARA